MTISIFENLRAQGVINGILEKLPGFELRDYTAVGNLTTGVLKFPDGSGNEISFVLLDGNYMFMMNESSGMYKSKPVENYNGSMTQVSYYGFYDEKFDDLVCTEIASVDVIEKYHFMLFRFALAVIDVRDPEILYHCIEWNHVLAMLNIETYYEKGPLLKLLLFEDQIDGASKLVMQYKCTEEFDAETFEEVMMPYVDEIEPVDEML